MSEFTCRFCFSSPCQCVRSGRNADDMGMPPPRSADAISDDTEYQRRMQAGGTANDFITQRINNGLCPICDWPMADSQERGCIPGDCCYRPDDPAEQRRIRERRAALKSHSDADAMSDDIKDIKIGDISPSEYIRGIKNGNIDPSFDNAVKALLWAADEIERLRGARLDAIEECARICETGGWVGYANQHSPTKSCALAIRDLAR